MPSAAQAVKSKASENRKAEHQGVSAHRNSAQSLAEVQTGTALQLAPVQRKQSPNRTGIPTQMKEDFEKRSGLSFDDVRVHYNSDKPAQLQALAYTQGSEVHIGPGQERHLPHELGHVVQQKQGRVRPTLQLNGMDINDDFKLEREADTDMLGNCNDIQHPQAQRKNAYDIEHSNIIQRVRKVNLLEQSGGNCGLYCIRMAINSLGSNTLKDEDYTQAAEAAGSYVGEIFSFTTMSKIVKNLGYTAHRRGFKNGVELCNVINETANNPALIAYSADIFGFMEDGVPPTQKGHWSIIEGLSGMKLSIANPWGTRHNFDIKDMYGSNHDMSSTLKKGKPVFSWDSFTAGIAPKEMMPMTADSDDGSDIRHLFTTPYIINRTNQITVSKDGKTNPTPIPKEQPLDLSGYIVEISIVKPIKSSPTKISQRQSRRIKGIRYGIDQK